MMQDFCHYWYDYCIAYYPDSASAKINLHIVDCCTELQLRDALACQLSSLYLMNSRSSSINISIAVRFHLCFNVDRISRVFPVCSSFQSISRLLGLICVVPRGNEASCIATSLKRPRVVRFEWNVLDVWGFWWYVLVWRPTPTDPSFIVTLLSSWVAAPSMIDPRSSFSAIDSSDTN